MRARRKDDGVFDAGAMLAAGASDTNVKVVVMRGAARLHHDLGGAFTNRTRDAVLFGVAQESRTNVRGDEDERDARR